MEPQSPLGMPQQSTSTIPRQPEVGGQSAAKPLVGLIGIIVLIALLVGGYLYIPQIIQIGDTGNEDVIGTPMGLLVMAAAPEESSGLADWIFPTTYDFTRGQFAYVPVDKLALSPDGINLAYQHVFSHNGDFVTFIGATDIKSASSLSEIPMQVYLTDVSGAVSYDDFVGDLQQAELITDSTGVVRQFPSVSNVGDVLYMAHSPTKNNQELLSSEADTWDIYVISRGGEEQMLVKGMHPKWIDDGHFVFLKNDGLYLYDLASGSEKKVWDSRGTATMRMSLDVSDDAQYIAWAAQESGSVFILRALNWDTGTLTLKGIISAPGAYAVFSPDSRYVAVQWSSPNETFDTWAVAIDTFDLKTLAKIPSPISLIGSEPNVTYLTDWRP